MGQACILRVRLCAAVRGPVHGDVAEEWDGALQGATPPATALRTRTSQPSPPLRGGGAC
jgi:hypothetical protein